MVFGLQLSFSRVGSTLNNLVMSVSGPHVSVLLAPSRSGLSTRMFPLMFCSPGQRYYDFVGHGDTGHKVLGTALWLGAFICAASLLTAIIAAYLDL